jgi:hypothetical protein
MVVLTVKKGSDANAFYVEMPLSTDVDAATRYERACARAER